MFSQNPIFGLTSLLNYLFASVRKSANSQSKTDNDEKMDIVFYEKKKQNAFFKLLTTYLDVTELLRIKTFTEVMLNHYF